MPDAGDARYTTASATSSTLPNLPIGIRPNVSFAKPSSSKKGRLRGVSINVGPTEFTLIPYGANSTPMALVNPSIACLLAQ